jgi:hypothetical protein
MSPVYVIRCSYDEALLDRYYVSEQAVVLDLAGGHIPTRHVGGIDFYDTEENFARSVTEDIARALANYLDQQNDGVTPDQRDFIEQWCGLAMARGLPVRELTFSA